MSQYRQTKHNFNQVLRETTKNTSIIWQQVAKSAIVFVSGEANVEELIPSLQTDFEHLPSSVVVRVPKLPMNAKVEIEILVDYPPMAGSDAPHGLSC